MKKLMVLDEDEVRIVLARRENILRIKTDQAKQLTCDHTWRFVCHCHNDAAYECTKCGEAEYR